jgi:hypothetical protein
MSLTTSFESYLVDISPGAAVALHSLNWQRMSTELQVDRQTFPKNQQKNVSKKPKKNVSKKPTTKNII